MNKIQGIIIFIMIVTMLITGNVLREWVCGYLCFRKKALGPWEGDLTLKE